MVFTKRLSGASTRIAPIRTAEISRRVALLEKQGHQVVNLVYGENRSPIPQSAADAGSRCYLDRTFPYAKCPGTPGLRDAYAANFRKMGVPNVTADNVVIGCGTLELLELVCQSILEPGDQALLISPYYFLYPHRIWKPGAEVVVAQTSFETNHKITPELLEETLKAHPHIRLLILNSPNNPSAMMYTRPELNSLAWVINKYDIWVLADEVYHEIFFGLPHTSFASIKDMAERTVTFDSASKTLAMGGERIGAMTANKELIAEMIKNKTHATFSTSLSGQIAAEAALRDPALGQYMQQTRDAFRGKRDLLANVIRADFPQAARYHLPQGTFYFSFELPADLIVPGNYEDWMDTSMRFAIYVLNQKHVAVTPGQAAGYSNLIRLSCAVEDESLKAVSRIGEALKELGV